MKIAIIGAGIAGLASAILFAKKGFEVSVYEKREKVEDIGAGIVCWPNACFVLDKLGLIQKIQKKGGVLHAMQRLSQDGEDLGSLDIKALNKAMGWPSFSILRRDLMDVLLNEVRRYKVKLHFTTEVSAIIDTGEGVTQLETKDIASDNGSYINDASWDLVIAADGRMHSIGRQYVCGIKHVQPIYQGFINWIGVYEGEASLLNELNVKDFWGVGQRFGVVPVSPNKIYWAGGVCSESINDRTPEHYKVELLTLFRHWPTPIHQLITQSKSSDINKLYIHDHDPIQTWHKNNVILIGDAAHAALPTSGQGACQALEDAWHLTQCIGDYDPHIPRGKTLQCSLIERFKMFEKIRMKKTSTINQMGRSFAQSLFNTNLEFCRERNKRSKNIDYQQQVRGMADSWGYGLN